MIMKADLRHRSFYLRTSKLISSHRSSLLLFFNKGLVSLYLGKSISNVCIVYDLQMIYCNNGQLQIEQKKQKQKNPLFFNRKRFQKQGQENCIP